MKQQLKIKPLSVNDAWQGRRYKTKKYKAYEKIIKLMLKNQNFPNGKVFLKIEFGFSNAGSDIDNPLKPFLDILQKKYKFNDNQIIEGFPAKSIGESSEILEKPTWAL